MKLIYTTTHVVICQGVRVCVHLQIRLLPSACHSFKMLFPSSNTKALKNSSAASTQLSLFALNKLHSFIVLYTGELCFDMCRTLKDKKVEKTEPVCKRWSRASVSSMHSSTDMGGGKLGQYLTELHPRALFSLQ